MKNSCRLTLLTDSFRQLDQKQAEQDSDEMESWSSNKNSSQSSTSILSFRSETKAKNRFAFRNLIKGTAYFHKNVCKYEINIYMSES